MTLWRHTNLCRLCQKRENTNGLVACVFLCIVYPKSDIYTNNNKKIIEFGSRRIWGIIKASVCVITQTSALIIPYILLDLIQ